MTMVIGLLVPWTVHTVNLLLPVMC